MPLRVPEIPLLPGFASSTAVGLHREAPIGAAVAISYPFVADVGLGETWLSEQSWAVSDLTQGHEFVSGELFSGFGFPPGVMLRRFGRE